MSSCPKGKIVNPKTGRCVKINGKIGLSIIAMPAQKQNTSQKPISPKPSILQKSDHDHKTAKKSHKDDLKILSYNIHNGWYDYTDVYNTFYEMIKWMIEVDPDVVLFQEVTFREISKTNFESTMKELGYKYIAYGFADDLYGKNGGNFFGQATCSKLPWKHKPISLNLSRDPVNNEGRNALFVTLENGLTIVNLHLDVWDRSGKTRLKQIKEMDHVLNEYKLFPAMVCGDFNTQRRRDYTNAQWETLQKHYVVETIAIDYIESFGVKDVLDLVGKKSVTSIPGVNRRIDFMFAFDPYDQVKVQSADIVKNVYFSDHFPVISTIRVV